MPGHAYYEGHPLADGLRAFAEHHFELHTRHISRYEYEMLMWASEVLDQSGGGQQQEDTQGAA